MGGTRENLSEEMTVAQAPFTFWVSPVKEEEETELSQKLPAPLICGSASPKQSCQQPLLETWAVKAWDIYLRLLGWLFPR